MNYNPHEYQKEAIKFLLEHACAGLFLDPGLGKTSIVYATYRILRKAGMAQKMLVVAPLRPAISVWPREAQKWDEFRDIKVTVLHGPNKKQNLEADYDVYVINPEGLQWLFEQFRGKRIPFDILVVDESTRFKHTDTKRFKTLRPWLPFFRRRYILTGSPAPNGLMDLFGQIYILDLGHSLGKFVTHYRMNYFNNIGYGKMQNYVLKSGASTAIQEKIAPLTLRMAAKDYLNLPPLLFNTIEVDLPERARLIYDQMEELMIAELETGTVLAANAAAATMKCRQIANGGIYVDAEGTFENIHEAKLEAVQELIDGLGGKPALIAYEFKHDLDRLRSAFDGAPYLGGGVTSHRQREIEDGWNAGGIPILLAQPQSVAHGLNLQGVGAAIIFHSETYNLEDREQLIRRVWRQGQTERIMVHDIVARNTVDIALMKAVEKKDKTQQSLLSALREYAAARRAHRPVDISVEALYAAGR